MMGRTHLAFGVLAGLMFMPFYHHNLILYFVLVLIGALLPDIDHEGSKINSIFPITRWLARFFKHRGFFHSIFPPLIIFGALWYFNWGYIGIALGVGYLSHLFSDGLTKMGVNFLHPVANLHLAGFIETGKVAENVVFFAVIVLSIVKVVSLVV
ncbi:MAG: metal-dependent hydrolase [Nanoarchaeota archaeon]|nr:metal-dependent hydrolase [Nanoarchaeota archaeon]